AKGVWADIFMDSRFLSGLLDDQKNHHAGQLLPTAIEKDIFLMASRRSLMNAHVVFVKFQILQSIFPDRHQALLISFADDFKGADFGKDLPFLQFNQLTDTQAGAVEYFEHRPVTVTFRFAQLDSLQQLLDFLKTQGIGKLPTEFWSLQKL